MRARRGGTHVQHRDLGVVCHFGWLGAVIDGLEMCWIVGGREEEGCFGGRGEA